MKPTPVRNFQRLVRSEMWGSAAASALCQGTLWSWHPCQHWAWGRLGQTLGSSAGEACSSIHSAPPYVKPKPAWSRESNTTIHARYTPKNTSSFRSPGSWRGREETQPGEGWSGSLVVGLCASLVHSSTPDAAALGSPGSSQAFWPPVPALQLSLIFCSQAVQL